MNINFLDQNILERLTTSGLVDKFGKAAKECDKDAATLILKEIQLSDQIIEKILHELAIV